MKQKEKITISKTEIQNYIESANNWILENDGSHVAGYHFLIGILKGLLQRED